MCEIQLHLLSGWYLASRKSALLFFFNSQTRRETRLIHCSLVMIVWCCADFEKRCTDFEVYMQRPLVVDYNVFYAMPLLFWWHKAVSHSGFIHTLMCSLNCDKRMHRAAYSIAISCIVCESPHHFMYCTARILISLVKNPNYTEAYYGQQGNWFHWSNLIGLATTTCIIGGHWLLVVCSIVIKIKMSFTHELLLAITRLQDLWD